MQTKPHTMASISLLNPQLSWHPVWPRFSEFPSSRPLYSYSLLGLETSPSHYRYKWSLIAILTCHSQLTTPGVYVTITQAGPNLRHTFCTSPAQRGGQAMLSQVALTLASKLLASNFGAAWRTSTFLSQANTVYLECILSLPGGKRSHAREEKKDWTIHWAEWIWQPGEDRGANPKRGEEKRWAARRYLESETRVVLNFWGEKKNFGLESTVERICRVNSESAHIGTPYGSTPLPPAFHSPDVKKSQSLRFRYYFQSVSKLCSSQIPNVQYR